MIEGIASLKEETCNLGVNLIDFEALKQSPVEDLVKEWVYSARNRAMRNSFGHPFGSSIPESLRKASLKFYSKCLQHEITKICYLLLLLKYFACLKIYFSIWRYLCIEACVFFLCRNSDMSLFWGE